MYFYCSKVGEEEGGDKDEDGILYYMDEAEIKKTVTKVLEQYSCQKFSFDHPKQKDISGISVAFSMEKEYALKVYEKFLDGVNFYGFGWLMGPLSIKEDGEYKIDFKKI